MKQQDVSTELLELSKEKEASSFLHPGLVRLGLETSTRAWYSIARFSTGQQLRRCIVVMCRCDCCQVTLTLGLAHVPSANIEGEGFVISHLYIQLILWICVKDVVTDRELVHATQQCSLNIKISRNKFFFADFTAKMHRISTISVCDHVLKYTHSLPPGIELWCNNDPKIQLC